MASSIHIFGPCAISWAANPLGHSREGFSVRINMNRRAVQVDNAGDIPAALLYKGVTAEVSGVIVKFDESILEELIDYYAVADIGTGIMSSAAVVVITSAGGTYTFWKCLPAPNIELGPLGVNEIAVPMTFIAYPYTDGKLYTKA